MESAQGSVLKVFGNRISRARQTLAHFLGQSGRGKRTGLPQHERPADSLNTGCHQTDLETPCGDFVLSFAVKTRLRMCAQLISTGILG